MTVSPTYFPPRRLTIFVCALAIGCVLLISTTIAHAKGKSAPREGIRAFVLPFASHSADSKFSHLAAGLSDMVATDLSNSEKLVIVEREQLRLILQEFKIQRGRYFSPKTRVRLGKGLAANFMIAGSVKVSGQTVQIEMRLISVASGVVDFSSRVRGDKDAIFQLEEKLVGQFLKRLGYRFDPPAIPRARAEQFAILLAYSKGLNLLDEGKEAEAVESLRGVVSRAPAFGLVRMRLQKLKERQGEIIKGRQLTLAKRTQSVFDNARKFMMTHGTKGLSLDESKRYLVNRQILGAELSLALRDTLLVGPRKKPMLYTLPRNSKKGHQLLRAYAIWARTLWEEHQELTSVHTGVSASLPYPESKAMKSLGIEFQMRPRLEIYAAYVLMGEFKLGDRSVRLQPTLANLEPTFAKEVSELTLTKARDKATSDSNSIRLYEILASYYFRNMETESGIQVLQEAMDRFPTSHRWKYLDERVQEKLGLRHTRDHIEDYRKGLKSCVFKDLNLGMSNAISRRATRVGLAALKSVEKEVYKKCKGAKKFDEIERTLLKDLFLSAARFGACDEFEHYMARWLKSGGSALDSSGYRKNYSNCR